MPKYIIFTFRCQHIFNLIECSHFFYLLTNCGLDDNGEKLYKDLEHATSFDHCFIRKSD